MGAELIGAWMLLSCLVGILVGFMLGVKDERSRREKQQRKEKRAAVEQAYTLLSSQAKANGTMQTLDSWLRTVRETFEEHPGSDLIGLVERDFETVVNTQKVLKQRLLRANEGLVNHLAAQTWSEIDEYNELTHGCRALITTLIGIQEKFDQVDGWREALASEPEETVADQTDEPELPEDEPGSQAPFGVLAVSE